MKDFAGQKTTYYTLAKDRLKGKHPRVYNLILILMLISMTGTAAFLITDIVSFGLDPDAAKSIDSSGLLKPAGSDIPGSSQSEIESKSKLEGDTLQKANLPKDSPAANSSPKEEIKATASSNSSPAGKSGTADGGLNTSDSSQNVSQSSPAVSSILSSRNATAPVGIARHKSSSGSGSSRSKSSSKDRSQVLATRADNTTTDNAIKNSTITNNATANSTVANNGVGNSTIRNDTVTNKTGAGAGPVHRNLKSQSSLAGYGNASPQSTKGAKNEPRSDSASIRAETGQSEEKSSRAGPGSTVLLQESGSGRQPALPDGTSYKNTESDRLIFKTESSLKIDLRAAQPAASSCMNCQAKTTAKAGAAKETDVAARAETTEMGVTIAESGTTEIAESDTNEKAEAAAEMRANEENGINAKTRSIEKIKIAAKTGIISEAGATEKAEAIPEAKAAENTAKTAEMKTTAKAGIITQMDLPEKTNTAMPADTSIPADRAAAISANTAMPADRATSVEVIKITPETENIKATEKTEAAGEHRAPAKKEVLRENSDQQKVNPKAARDYSSRLTDFKASRAACPAKQDVTIERNSDEPSITSISALPSKEQSRIDMSRSVQAGSSTAAAKSRELQERRSEQMAERDRTRDEQRLKRIDAASSPNPSKLPLTAGEGSSLISASASGSASQVEDKSGSKVGDGSNSWAGDSKTEDKSKSQTADSRNIASVSGLTQSISLADGTGRAESATRAISSTSRDMAYKDKNEALEKARSTIYVKTRDLRNRRSLQMANRDKARDEHNDAAVTARASAAISRENAQIENIGAKKKAVYVKSKELQKSRSIS